MMAVVSHVLIYVTVWRNKKKLHYYFEAQAVLMMNKCHPASNLKIIDRALLNRWIAWEGNMNIKRRWQKHMVFVFHKNQSEPFLFKIYFNSRQEYKCVWKGTFERAIKLVCGDEPSQQPTNGTKSIF